MDDKKKINILIAEDEPIASSVLGGVLKKLLRESYLLNVVEVEDGQKAIDVLLEGKFRIAFLDINMPSVSGLEVANKIFEMPEMDRPSVVFVSGDLKAAAEKLKGKIARSADYSKENYYTIGKPISVKRIEEILKKCGILQ